MGRAKAFDGACVLADWVDVSEVQDWAHVTYSFHINDQLRQSGDTALLLRSIGEYLCDMSQAFTLEAGDVVMTGTPAGVGALTPGDRLKMTLNGKTKLLFGKPLYTPTFKIMCCLVVFAIQQGIALNAF